MHHNHVDGQIATWLGERQASTYADGRRCDEIGYLQCKLILKPDRFTSARVFKEFAALVQRAAQTTGVGFQHTPKFMQRPDVREVLFLDTGGYHLYNNSFIVRRRIAYQDGFAIGDPEIVFKYRSDDMARAQLLDVLRQLGATFAAAHGVGVCHLGLRPSKVIVSYSATRAPQVHLQDLGLLAALEKPERAATSATRLPKAWAVAMSPGGISSGEASEGETVIRPENEPT